MENMTFTDLLELIAIIAERHYTPEQARELGEQFSIRRGKGATRQRERGSVLVYGY